MTLEDAQRGPFGNVITRAVGIQRTVHADTLVFDLLPNDTFLLCSDGLCKYAKSTEELGSMLDNDHAASIPQQLITLANARGGSDNISAVVIRAESELADGVGEMTRTTDVTGKLKTLREISLFRLLDMGELCKVLNICESRFVGTDEMVICEGDKGDALYAIIDGELRVTRNGKTVVDLASGQHVGDMALVNSRPRSASVLALRPTRLLVVERSKFNDLIRKEPALGVKLLWSLAQVLSLRLDETSDLLVGEADGTANPFPVAAS